VQVEIYRPDDLPLEQSSRNLTEGLQYAELEIRS